MSFVDTIMAWIASLPYPAVIALIAFVVFGKYVFPPVPTDIVTVIAAFLAGKLGWAIGPLVAAYLFGSVLGIAAAHRMGVWLSGIETWPRLIERFRPQLDKIVDQFRERGPRLVVTNRFIPVVRDFAIVAAGLAGMTWQKTLGFGMISATLWAAVVFVLAATAGQNWDVVMDRLAKLGTATWILFAVAIGGLLLARWWHKRSRPA